MSDETAGGGMRPGQALQPRCRHKTSHFMVGLVAIIAVSILYGMHWTNRPAYNWDMLGYIAVALEDAGTPRTEIHKLTYESLAALPKPARDDLTEVAGFRAHVAADTERFMDQLPFYSVKPLYPWLVSLLYRGGVPLPQATVIVSATAYECILILLFLWFSHFASPILAALLVGFLAPTPFLSHLAQLSTPDALSVLILLLGFYVSLEKEHHGGAVAILILAVLARPENLIYVVGFFSYLAIVGGLSLGVCVASCLIAMAVFFAETHLSGYYGYRTLIYYTFVDFDTDVKHFVSPLGFKQYALIYLGGVSNMLLEPTYYFGIFASLALGTFGITSARGAWSEKYLHMTVFACTCAAARFAILPAEFDRAFLVPYITVLIAFVVTCSGLRSRVLQW